MADLNVKTGIGVTALLGVVAAIGMALGILNFAKIVFVALIGATGVLALKLSKSGKASSTEDPLLKQITGSSSNETGGEMNSILDELEAWLQGRGLQIYINWLNDQFSAYPIFSLEGDVFWFYSFFLEDKKSGQHLHICVESTTQRIVYYGAVKSLPRELYWPQDYVPAIEALERAQQRKTSKNIKNMLQSADIGRLQGDHDFGSIPVDKTEEPNDGVIEARTTQ